MANFYIVPRVGTGATLTDTFRPKYFGEVGTYPQLAGVVWSGMDFGFEPVFLIGADVTQAQHNLIAAQGDVFVVPSLDATVGGNPTLGQVRNGLEQRGLPGSWVLATTTYRQLLGRVARVCQIAQRMAGRHNKRMFESGVTLDSMLTMTLLADLQSVGASFGMNTSGLTTATTVRAASLLLADQFPQIVLAGEVL